MTTPPPRSSRSHPSHRDAGFAMLLVMIAIAIASIIALEMLASLTPATVLASNTRGVADAQAVAQGGLDAVEAYLEAHPDDWTTDFTTKTEGWWTIDAALGGGTYSVYATRTDGDDADNAEAFAAGDRVTLSATANASGVAALASRVVETAAESNESIRVLFVLNDQTSPSSSSQDEYRSDLMQGWGFDVAYISSRASQSEFDAAVGNADVAYITENVYSGDVNTKLKDATIGVVNEDGYLADDLGMASSQYNFYASHITVVDNTHEITEGFPLGHVYITTSDTNVHAIIGTHAPDLNILAQSDHGSYYAKLALIEPDDSLYGGGTAAGRRVMLPWGGSSFDATRLSTDGLTIMQRSLEWAAALTAGGSDSSPHVQIDGKIEVKPQAVIDSYDSSSTAYSGGSASSNAVVASNTTSGGDIKLEGNVSGDVYCGTGGTPSSVIDISGGSVTGNTAALTSALDTSAPSAPTGFPGSSGDRTISSNTTLGTTSASTQVTYGKLEIKSGARLTIRGAVEINVNDEMKVEDNGQLVLDPDATLKLYVDDKLEILKSVDFNADSQRTGDLEVYLYSGSANMLLDEQSEAAGFFHVGDKLEIKKNANLYGRVIVGDILLIEEDAAIHADEALGTP